MSEDPRHETDQPAPDGLTTGEQPDLHTALDRVSSLSADAARDLGVEPAAREPGNAWTSSGASVEAAVEGEVERIEELTDTAAASLGVAGKEDAAATSADPTSEAPNDGGEATSAQGAAPAASSPAAESARPPSSGRQEAPARSEPAPTRDSLAWRMGDRFVSIVEFVDGLVPWPRGQLRKLLGLVALSFVAVALALFVMSYLG